MLQPFAGERSAPASTPGGGSPAIACLGAGSWGKNLVRNFHALGALSMICDPSRDVLGRVGESYPDVQLTHSPVDAFSDPSISAVVIATPAETHADLVRLALLAGKDVFVEKPLALTAVEGEALVELAETQGRILMVGHLLWYHPAVLRLKELVVAGELGRIQYIYSNRLNLGKIRREENILWSFAPHDISVILGMVGETPISVQAMGGNYLHDQIADVTVSMLAFPSGVRAHIFVSWLHPFKEQKLVIVGDRQMAVFDDLAPKDKLVLYPHAIEWRDQLPVPNRAAGVPISIEASEPLREEAAHFLHCVATRSRPRTDGAEALRVLRTLERCQRAIASSGPAGQRVRKQAAHTERPAGHRSASIGDAYDRSGQANTAAQYVHPSAVVDDGAKIGPGTRIWHFCHVSATSEIGAGCSLGQNVFVADRVRIGNNVKVQNNVSLYEGVILEDDVFCGPSMVFTNIRNPRSAFPKKGSGYAQTLVKRGATIGANATIVCGTTIGEHGFIAAGAVVTRDVQPFEMVAGVPARRIGWGCICGERLTMTEAGATCATCGRLYMQNAAGGLEPQAQE